MISAADLQHEVHVRISTSARYRSKGTYYSAFLAKTDG